MHQTWRTQDIPQQFVQWQTQWRKLHPHWEYRFYDDSDIRRIILDRAPSWLKVHDRLPRQIQRVDMFRYLIVYLDGGLYADLDTEPYRPSDELLKGASCVFGIEHHLGLLLNSQFRYPHPWQIANFIFAAAPGHQFFGELLDRIGEYASRPVRQEDDVEETTGPRMLTRLVFGLPAARRGNIRILPQVNWNGPSEFRYIKPLARLMHARHHCAGTWRAGRGPKWWYNSLSWRHWRGAATTSSPSLE